MLPSGGLQPPTPSCSDPHGLGARQRRATPPAPSPRGRSASLCVTPTPYVVPPERTGPGVDRIWSDPGRSACTRSCHPFRPTPHRTRSGAILRHDGRNSLDALRGAPPYTGGPRGEAPWRMALRSHRVHPRATRAHPARLAGHTPGRTRRRRLVVGVAGEPPHRASGSVAARCAARRRRSGVERGHPLRGSARPPRRRAGAGPPVRREVTGGGPSDGERPGPAAREERWIGGEGDRHRRTKISPS